MSKDFYNVLNVPRESSQEDIKKAYKKMAFKYHPDRNKDDKAKEEKFKEASEAYQVLGDPKKRQRYDQVGHGAFNGGGGFQDVGDIFSSFKDIFSGGGFGDVFSSDGAGNFEDLFSGSGFGRTKTGVDLHYKIELNLKEVLTGVEKEISFTGNSSCSKCKGSGAKPGSKRKQCSRCGGRGQTLSQTGFFSFASPCSACKGQGSSLEHPCATCYGKGHLKKKRVLSVNIPPGVNSGTKLRLQGEGEPGPHGVENGDFYLEVSLKSHPIFRKNGRDLISSISVTYLQALLGTEKSFQGLTEEEKITIPPGTQHGTKIKLAHAGLPSLNQPTRGDLLCEISVEFPKKLKKQEEELLRQIAVFKNENVLNKKGKKLF